MTNYEKKCCRMHLEAQNAAKANAMPAKGDAKGGGKKADGKGADAKGGGKKGEGGKKGDHKGGGKYGGGKKGTGKDDGKAGKGKDGLVCSNCGEAGHMPLACPNPPKGSQPTR